MPSDRYIAEMIMASISIPVLICASLFFAAIAPPAAASPLEAERWQKRVVIVFADRNDAAAKRQIDKLLSERQKLAERDMVVVAALGNEASVVFGTMGKVPDGQSLRREYGVSSGLTTILVGKDGGEKLRESEQVSADEIFALIDAMPMRRDEASGQ